MYNLSSVKVETVEPYDGRITLFRPNQTNRSIADTSLGWRDVGLRGIDIVWVPGDHESMFTEPNISAFGQLLDQVLEKQDNRKDPDPVLSHDAPYEVSQLGDPDSSREIRSTNVSSTTGANARLGTNATR
jgi:hypothetical protein